MCGIAGWYARGGEAVTQSLVEAQCDAIRHRGPDDSGILIDGDFGFGMRRLSIIDVAGGHQPIRTADRRLSIVFNGEIYNHRELRVELGQRGHAFRTQSDTETVLCAFDEWGNDAWRRLDGMFAVAIWDRPRRRLTLARDHMGIKPLYYSEQRGGLAFGSELKALLALPAMQFDIDPRAVHDFFSFGHIRTDRSIYSQVRTLPPGHHLTVGPAGEPRIERFWRPAYRSSPPRSEAAWVEEFREVWLRSVNDHLLADVEIGAFLSGGIDSTAVVAAMTRLTGRSVRTFTIGFPIERYDESPHAEAVARHFGCEHVTRIIGLEEARDVLPRLADVYDEPFADASAVPTWYVSRLAREHVKVVMSGDGGDELFMGYKRHLTERTVGALPVSLRRAARGIMAIPPTSSRTLNHRLGRWQKAVSTAGLPDGISRFFARTQITSADFRHDVMSAELMDQHEGERFFETLRDEYFPDPKRTVSPDHVEQFALADLMVNLPGAMLTKVDRASMAHSLEVRVPMLSQAMVAMAMAMPRELKIRNGVGKHLLREAIRPWIPEGIGSRRKQGFQIPLAEWFEGDFGRYAREIWEDSGIAGLGYLNRPAIERVFAEHRDGRRDHGRFLYALSMFGLWAAGCPAATPATVGASPASVRTRVPVHGTLGLPANDNRRPSERRAPRWRIAAAAAMLLAGWLARDVTGPFAAPVQAETFVDQAVDSHRATLIRATMRSQHEVADYDRSEIARATGIVMPALPSDWTLLDAQVYPSDGGPSVELAVRTSHGEQFSVFGMKADTPGGASPSLEHRSNDHIAFWEDGQFAFALVGSVSSARLLALAELLDRN